MGKPEGDHSCEGPPAPSDDEGACDQRSGPQDGTSSPVRGGGVNLQPEVVPHLTERPPRDSPEESTPDRVSGVNLNIQPDRAAVRLARVGPPHLCDSARGSPPNRSSRSVGGDLLEQAAVPPTR